MNNVIVERFAAKTSAEFNCCNYYGYLKLFNFLTFIFNICSYKQCHVSVILSVVKKAIMVKHCKENRCQISYCYMC